MFVTHRIFCATAWELEGERRAFYDLIGAFNEATAMPQGLLYVPVSLMNVRDKRPYQYTVEENIRSCRHFLMVLCEHWGPPERNFQPDYALAQECWRDPQLPMREVAMLARKPLAGATRGAGLPAPDAEFASVAEFQQVARDLLERWFVAAREEAGRA